MRCGCWLQMTIHSIVLHMHMCHLFLIAEELSPFVRAHCIYLMLDAAPITFLCMLGIDLHLHVLTFILFPGKDKTQPQRQPPLLLSSPHTLKPPHVHFKNHISIQDCSRTFPVWNAALKVPFGHACQACSRLAGCFSFSLPVLPLLVTLVAWVWNPLLITHYVLRLWDTLRCRQSQWYVCLSVPTCLCTWYAHRKKLNQS